MIEGLLTKHAMAGHAEAVQRSAGARARWSARRSASSVRPATATAGAPLHAISRRAGHVPRRRRRPATGPGAQDWKPVEITKSAVARERRGPANGFEVTFPQGVMWGIIGCVMSFAIGLVSERVHGTFVRLQMAPLTRIHDSRRQGARVLRGDHAAADHALRAGRRVLRHSPLVAPAPRDGVRLGGHRLRRLHDDGGRARPHRAGRSPAPAGPCSCR